MSDNEPKQQDLNGLTHQERIKRAVDAIFACPLTGLLCTQKARRTQCAKQRQCNRQASTPNKRGNQ